MDLNKREYFIAPGSNGKMYVLRMKGFKRYGSNVFPYNNLVKILSTDIEEAKIKAEEYLGNKDFFVNDAPLTPITRRGKDPDKEWKWQFGQYKGQDIRNMDWEDPRIQNYGTWWWNANKDNQKSIEFHKKIQDLLLDKEILINYNDEILTKKDYEYRKKKEGWKAEAQEQAAKSDFVGDKGDKIRREIKLVFTTNAGETRWGTFYVSKFLDQDGNTLMLKGPHPPFTEKNVFHDCVFIIKDYSEYKGEKQTVITRIKDLAPKAEQKEEVEDYMEEKIPYRPEQEYSAEDYANESFYPMI